MTSTYIETGNEIRVYDSAVKAHDKFPLGTYRVNFDPKSGFSLIRLDDLVVGDERVYGDRERKVDKIFRTYERSARSLGVLLSGDKGQGKSLFLRMVAERANKLDLPVVLVNQDADGLADFLDTLDECMIVFDEFEKIFPSNRRSRGDNDSESGNRQNQFLSLFDGISSTKRIYCLTVNNVHDVSTYLVNRPGRFHYHMRFDYPGPDEVREYLNDQAPEAAPAEIESAALFSKRVSLNYDHLRAIAFELNAPGSTFAEIVQDLNIKAVEPSDYRIEATYADGRVLAHTQGMNLFERADVSKTVHMHNAGQSLYFSFTPSDLTFDEDGVIRLPVEKLSMRDDDDDDEPEERPVTMTFTLVGQASYAFDAV